jgi:hypothetical protein
MGETSGGLGPGEAEAPRRVVPEWEYRTAYIETFQVRLRSGLYERLSQRAGQEGKSPETLLIEILERAVKGR